MLLIVIQFFISIILIICGDLLGGNMLLLGYGLLVCSLIFANGLFRCKYNGGNDILMTKLGIFDLDGWSISHFLFFMFLGTQRPNLFVPAMLMGAAWEGIEAGLGKSRPSWMGGFGDCDLSTDQINSSHQNWWFGRFSDLIMNAIGFLVGIQLKKKLI